MLLFSSILVFLLKTLKCYPDKILETEYNILYGRYYLQVFIGPSNNSYSLRIDLSTSYINVEGAEMDNIDIIEPFTMKSTYYLPILALHIKKNITLCKDISLPMHLYNINDTRYSKILSQTVGMGPKIENDKFSLVHQLKQQGFINKLIFSFAPRTKLVNPFYFGGLPNKLNPSYTNMTTCKSNFTFFNTWGCYLDYVFFDGFTKPYEIFTNNNYAFFQTITSEVLVTKKFIDYLVNMILRKEIQNKNCFSFKTGMMNDYNTFIHCECNVFEHLPNINFVIGGKIHKFNMKDLFDYFLQTDGMCDLMVYPNSNEDRWLFGTNFFAKYYTSFNYEEEKVSFYSTGTFESFVLDYRFMTITYLYLCTIVLMMIGGFALGRAGIIIKN